MRLTKDSSAFDSSLKRSTSSLSREAELRRAIRIARRTYSYEHPNVALAQIQLGDYFAREERFDEAESIYRQACQIYETLGLGHELLLAMALRSLSFSVWAQDRIEEGKAIADEARNLILVSQ